MGAHCVLAAGLAGAMVVSAAGECFAQSQTVGSWSQIEEGVVSRGDHAAVWTGSEMLVWGGWTSSSEPVAGSDFYYRTITDLPGERYQPGVGSQVLSTVDAPTPTVGGVVVWTGNEMIVWGGSYYVEGVGPYEVDTGARYDPAADHWTPMTT